MSQAYTRNGTKVYTWDYESDHEDNSMRSIMDLIVRPWRYTYGFRTTTGPKQKKKYFRKFMNKIASRSRKSTTSKKDSTDHLYRNHAKEHVKPELLSLIHRRMSMI